MDVSYTGPLNDGNGPIDSAVLVRAQRSKSEGFQDAIHHVPPPPLEAMGVFRGEKVGKKSLGQSRQDGMRGDFGRKISLLSQQMETDNLDARRVNHDGFGHHEDRRNNEGVGRSSFDVLFSELDCMEQLTSNSVRNRRKSESDSSRRPRGMGTMSVKSKYHQPSDGFSSFSNGSCTLNRLSSADYLRERERANNEGANQPRMEKMLATGLIIDSKPVTSSGRKEKFRAGPSEGAHASHLVDGADTFHGAMIQPARIIDADLHDTFGAHDWSSPPAHENHCDLSSHLKKSNRERIVSCTPTLSPIRSPIGSPMMSPQRNFMTTNLSSHVSPTYLERRSARLAELKNEDAKEVGVFGRGYIAEAKRVLDEAMHMLNDSSEERAHDSMHISSNGALYPLLKHLRSAAGDDGKCRAALRTLALLETNLPNRDIISDLEGRRILMDVVYKCSRDAIDVKESAIQLMWDLTVMLAEMWQGYSKNTISTLWCRSCAILHPVRWHHMLCISWRHSLLSQEHTRSQSRWTDKEIWPLNSRLRHAFISTLYLIALSTVSGKHWVRSC
jgi:hypothetical protein